ncbi:hypothetical protein LWC35_00745 [Pseudonocardia kujensis]|uniref:hypothetical protein n=1 Tax=Pseudonocardia kujensis TaxID=1128675 RepID=UPI001E432D1B|nr:hypothetical protein [Pseudonocardia kujensis]MCE0761450.1 hypothetical protein [Pseudonocardia kujensis]
MADLSANDTAVFHVRVRSADPAALQRLLATEGVDPGCRPRPRWVGESIEIEVYVDEDALSGLNSDPTLVVEAAQNLRALGSAGRAEVGVGDRFDGGRIAPRGLGEAV